MKKNTLILAVLVLALGLHAAPLRAQSFQKFVTVGDSLIMGEESGCVVQRFQQRSWVTLAAGLLGQSNFQQPFISEIGPTPLQGFPCLGAIFTGTSIIVGAVSQPGTNQNSDLAVPYDNLGFNGSPRVATFVDLKVTHPGPGLDLQNKAATVLRNCEGCQFEGMSAVDEANALGPDLVAFWGGNNDALDAMLAGVAIERVTLTRVDDFTASYDQVMAGLATPGRTVVAFNIPNLNDLPFVTTIPPVVVNPATLQPVLIDGQPVPLLGPGDAAYPCDPAPPCGLPPGTLVTLAASPLLSQGIGIPASLPGGTGQPLPHGSFVPPATVEVGVVLYPDDVSAIASHIEAFNSAIAASTTAHGVLFIDANAAFAELAQHGFTLGGITLTTKFLTGGIFSYDGIHPSAIGYGIVTQAFVRTLNAANGTNIPEPNFSTILFTPNVYSPTGALEDGGPFGYPLSAWRQLLSSIQLPDGIAIQNIADPTRLTGPIETGRPTRVVTRGGY